MSALELAPRRRADRRRGLLLALNVASGAAGLGVWWLWSANVDDVPTPVDVARRLGELFGDGTLEADILASLRRVLVGFLIGCAVAVPVGFLMGWYALARAVFEPWVQFFRTVPPLALIPLVVVLLGIGETAKYFVIFVAAFLSCVIATFQGVVNVDRTLLNAARVLGAPTRTIFARVVVPASLPYILVGMRVGLGSAWGTLVAAELVAAQEGLGYRMQSAEIYLERPTIFAALICIGVLGLLMDRLLLLVERRATDWQERR